MRLSGARQAREQQGVARQAVAYRVVHPVPPPLFGALRLHARRPAAQQRLRLFHAVDRRAVRVAQRLQRPQPLREALRQPLRQQAVRLHLRQVARRRVQDAPGLGHYAVLKAQHRVVDGAVGAVAQQPPGVDEVPHHAPLVGEGLREVRAHAVCCCCARCRPPPCCAPTGLAASRPAKTFGYQPGPRTATGSGRTASRRKVRQHAVHGLNAVRRAQDGQEKGALASPLRLQRTTSTLTYVLSFAHVCALKTRGGRGSGRTP